MNKPSFDLIDYGPEPVQAESKGYSVVSESAHLGVWYHLSYRAARKLAQELAERHRFVCFFVKLGMQMIEMYGRFTIPYAQGG